MSSCHSQLLTTHPMIWGISTCIVSELWSGCVQGGCCVIEETISSRRAQPTPPCTSSHWEGPVSGLLATVFSFWGTVEAGTLYFHFPPFRFRFYKHLFSAYHVPLVVTCIISFNAHDSWSSGYHGTWGN